jgi:hypothetical protein
MAVKISDIEALARLRLIEASASYWSSQELTDIIIAGIRDLWRDTVDLKQEHYLSVLPPGPDDTATVFFDANSNTLRGVPTDVHKVYMIEPLDLSATSSMVGLQFRPLDYNHRDFQLARSRDAIDPVNDTIWYAITGQGAPVNAPTIFCAPKVSSQVPIRFMYCPTLGQLNTNSTVPIPGEADNALVSWTVAFARAKEREDRSPDENWLAIYATEKAHLMQSLGLREYQEPSYTDALFDQYWG